MMSLGYTLAPIAAWFLFGMARIVLTSMLAEHRIDKPNWSAAMASNSKAAAERLNAANYDVPGRRLLPWYRVVNKTYWVVVAAGLLWIVLHRVRG
ncbi:MAG TPA: hypothetical protein VGM67_06830 [Gemmatimonadaceae bacterium]|jgi:hypothetical protein